jgi:O-methyltransferase
VESKIEDILKNDMRYEAFQHCVRYISNEYILGDILEFGVFNGLSLAMLTHHLEELSSKNRKMAYSCDRVFQPITRNIIGIDSFKGLPSTDGHPRWEIGFLSTSYNNHPTIKDGESISAEKIIDFFDKMNLKKPTLLSGWYEEIQLNGVEKTALIHIDCDLYSSTKTALNLVKDLIQQGTIIMFDDWFFHKGSPEKGEQRAFNEFLEENTHLKADEFLRYGYTSKAFVMHKTS